MSIEMDLIVCVFFARHDTYKLLVCFCNQHNGYILGNTFRKQYHYHMYLNFGNRLPITLSPSADDLRRLGTFKEGRLWFIWAQRLGSMHMKVKAAIHEGLTPDLRVLAQDVDLTDWFWTGLIESLSEIIVLFGRAFVSLGGLRRARGRRGLCVSGIPSPWPSADTG